MPSDLRASERPLRGGYSTRSVLTCRRLRSVHAGLRHRMDLIAVGPCGSIAKGAVFIGSRGRGVCASQPHLSANRGSWSRTSFAVRASTPNHQSLGLPALYLLPMDFRYVVKRKFAYSPFGFNIWLARNVWIDERKPNACRVFAECRRKARGGISLVMFPEVRGRDVEGWTLQTRRLRTASATQVPLLPVAIAGANDRTRSVDAHSSRRHAHHHRRASRHRVLGQDCASSREERAWSVAASRR